MPLEAAFEGDMMSTQGQELGEQEAIDTRLKKLLADILGLDEARVAEFRRDTELFGAIPEFDSMSVAGLLTEMEDRFDIEIDDDEVDGEIFETYGSLRHFAATKLAE